MTESINEVLERRLAHVRPINEIVGIATNATAWVGLSAFLVKIIWSTNLDSSAAYSFMRYPVTALACVTSIYAAYGLFWPLLKASSDLGKMPGPYGFLFAWLGVWSLSFGSIVWLLGVGFTFAGLAASLMPAAAP